MNAARSLRHARRRSGMSQRALAERTAVAQPTIARIERGVEVPRFDTLDRLLRACGESLEVVAKAGEGVDRTAMRELLRLTPAARVQRLVAEGPIHERLARARRGR